ncbi:MAG: hypothetical protein AAF197_08570 [Pseudomonadota bacterium]
MSRFVLLFLTAFIFASPVIAQNNVIVVPMAGDDVAMAQQHFVYKEAFNDDSGTDGTGSFFGCESDVFNTPDQATQAALVASGSAIFRTASEFWGLTLQYNKDGSGWTRITSGIRAWEGARTDGWTNISTLDVLDLDTNSSYQFRIEFTDSASGAAFDDFANEYCELMITASYKLPEGKQILEIAP